MSEVQLIERALIRHYIADLLKNGNSAGEYAVDVGGRVFTNRKSALSMDELPVVCVNYGDEPATCIAGSAFRVKEYQRNLTMVITVAVEAIQSPDDDIVQNPKGEDYLDWLGRQVERAIFYDWRLGRNLEDFDPNTNVIGLTMGHRLDSVSTYEVDTDTERKIIAQDIRFTFPYSSDAFVDKRFPSFEEYYHAIVRTGSTTETTDRELIEMQGTLVGG